ncbi:putative lipoprotein [Treponema primitia ZAS-2]|uniref:Putative lipoprotein n=1 Tax=Treponema primitia (strain ATCC BAA-887 / DSM 12427 / ZAS-2) TaxID=545694 RepID=F5YN92_TREPZ|nr:hypothetical protein [Treponema primitia]AEF87041.1 putative lipoprotein [Treponema primitia ZAS-2]
MRRNSAGFLVFFFIAFFLGSCFSPANDNYGALRLNLGGGSGNSRAAGDERFRYKIVCTGSSTESTETSGGAITIPLASGDWRVTVTVLDGRDVMGVGSAMATISPGKTSSVSIHITLNNEPWPSDKLADNGLSGLAQPASTTLKSFTDLWLVGMVITLGDADATDYDAFCADIRAIPGVTGPGIDFLGVRTYDCPGKLLTVSWDSDDAEITLTIIGT